MSWNWVLVKWAFDRGSSRSTAVRALTVAGDAVERWWWWWFEEKMVG